MDCDAKKKTMLKDLDGSFLGAIGTVIPQSEYEWNGDPRRGLGDYRIPKVMLTFPNGSRIPVEQIAPHKGEGDGDLLLKKTWENLEHQKIMGVNVCVLRHHQGRLRLHVHLAELQVLWHELQDVGD